MIFAVVLCIVTPLVTGLDIPDNHTIDGNTISIDDENIYLSATPHTIGSSGWVEFELNSKQYSGDIDILFGFNTNDASPKKLQLWSNYTHQHTERTLSVEYVNVSYYDENISQWVNTTEERHSFENEIVYETYYDWLDISPDFDVVNYDFRGMNKWFVKKDINIISNKNYKVRMYLEIPFAGLDVSQGAYFFAVKPSGETIQQAESNNHLYYLDPWWNSSWSCRVPIIIQHEYVDTWLHDYPILVKINETISDTGDGGDLRFTLDDNTTLLAYEPENYTNWGAAVTNYVWVNVTDISPDHDTLIWCYYENDAAADGRNGHGTWDGHFQAVWHCNDSAKLIDSTINDVDATAVNTPTNAAGLANGVVNLDPDDSDYFNAGNNCDQATNTFTLETWINYSQYKSGTQKVLVKKNAGVQKWFLEVADSADAYAARFAAIDEDDEVVTADVASRTDVPANGLWKYLVAQRNADQYFSLGICGVGYKYWAGNSIKTGTIGTLTNTEDLVIGTKNGGGNYLDDCIDEIRISDIVRNDSYINMTFEVIHNNSNVIIFGSIDCTGGVLSPTIVSLSPGNNTNNICPCNGSLCVEIYHTQGLTMNLSICVNGTYINETGLSNGTYCYCLCEIPIRYNRTYSWYANVSNSENAFSTISDIYSFASAEMPVNCTATSSSGVGSNVGIVGVVGIIGILGWLAHIRKKRRGY